MILLCKITGASLRPSEALVWQWASGGSSTTTTKTFLVWVNEEDHPACDLYAEGGNMKRVFNRFCADSPRSSLFKDRGHAFMRAAPGARPPARPNLGTRPACRLGYSEVEAGADGGRWNQAADRDGEKLEKGQSIDDLMPPRSSRLARPVGIKQETLLLFVIPRLFGVGTFAISRDIAELMELVSSCK
ncbi:creatine kinase B-type [Lates japonicus]|uniref:Creatine kinase B-type n=1 Tax=Lates japonicus TaxID=270547 RepID=A0AAD3NNI4_LATJO|nr:creatine kinase B-type [Lates japonicus]